MEATKEKSPAQRETPREVIEKMRMDLGNGRYDEVLGAMPRFRESVTAQLMESRTEAEDSESEYEVSHTERVLKPRALMLQKVAADAKENGSHPESAVLQYDRLYVEFTTILSAARDLDYLSEDMAKTLDSAVKGKSLEREEGRHSLIGEPLLALKEQVESAISVAKANCKEAAEAFATKIGTEPGVIFGRKRGLD